MPVEAKEIAQDLLGQGEEGVSGVRQTDWDWGGGGVTPYLGAVPSMQPVWVGHSGPHPLLPLYPIREVKGHDGLFRVVLNSVV